MASEKRRLDAMFSVRLSGDELAMVQRRATAAGLTVSSYLRRLALNDGPLLRPGERRFTTNVPYVTATF